EHRDDKLVQRSTVALDRTLEFEAFALRHDRHAVVADRAAQDDLVARTGKIGGDVDIVLDDADARRGDEDLVALAPVDNLGVAGDELDAGFGGGGAHRLDHTAKIVHRETFFEDKCG